MSGLIKAQKLIALSAAFEDDGVKARELRFKPHAQIRLMPAERREAIPIAIGEIDPVEFKVEMRTVHGAPNERGGESGRAHHQKRPDDGRAREAARRDGELK